MLRGFLLEGADGKSQRELEYTFMGLIRDFSELDRAEKVEEYEQWWLSTDDGAKPEGSVSGTIRVRSIDGKRFTMAVKRRSGGGGGSGPADRTETEVEITRDMFEAFKALAPTGMVKTRYTFPVPGTGYRWEVDVYGLPEGGQDGEWAKFDLEVDRELSKIPDPPVAVDAWVPVGDPAYRKELERIQDSQVIRRDDSILPIRKK